MKTEDGKFTRIKRILALLSGIWVGYASMYLSKGGIGFGDDLAWMAWGIAIALFCAEFMFNSKFTELSWTMILLGAGAYIYSIGVNINGFYLYRGMEGDLLSNFDLTNFGGGVFMDMYPEIAIAWALKESKVGDVIGNLFKAVDDPKTLLNQVNSGSGMPTKTINPQMMNNLPKAPFPMERDEPKEVFHFRSPKKNHNNGGRR